MPTEQRFGGMRRAYGHAADAGRFSQKVWGNLGQTGLGRAMQQGVAMDFGFYRAGPKMQPRGPGGRFMKGSPQQAFKFMGGREALAGMKGAGFKGAAKVGLKALPLIGNIAFMYMGYQEGGIGGAIGAGLEGLAFSVAWEAGAFALGSAAIPLAAAAAVVGGTAYGYYQFGEMAQRHGRKTRALEMGAEVNDRFGNVSTLRQRSLMALNNTHVNGRMAIGNEAALLHMPMF